MRITNMGDRIPGWSDKDPDTYPISGSETAVIRLSRELQRLGHTVDMGGGVRTVRNREVPLVCHCQGSGVLVDQELAATGGQAAAEAYRSRA